MASYKAANASHSDSGIASWVLHSVCGGGVTLMLTVAVPVMALLSVTVNVTVKVPAAWNT